MTALDKKDPGADMASQNQDPSPISLLKKIRGQGRVWLSNTAWTTRPSL